MKLSASKTLLDSLQREAACLGCDPQLIYTDLKISGCFDENEISLIKNKGTPAEQITEIFHLLQPKLESVFVELRKIFEKYKWNSLHKLVQDFLNANEEALRLLQSGQPNNSACLSNLGDEVVHLLQRKLCMFYDEDLNYFEKCWSVIHLLKDFEMNSFFNPHIEMKNMTSITVFEGFTDFLKAGYKSIILIGEQGCGKSMLTHEIASQWNIEMKKKHEINVDALETIEEKKDLQKIFDFVLIIRLEEINGMKSFVDVLSILFEKRNDADTFFALLETDAIQERTLFLFDGYDDFVSQDCQKLKDLIAKKFWPKATTLVTMRKSAFRRGAQFGKKPLTLNLSGFTDDGIKYQMTKFKLPTEEVAPSQKEILKVPLFLTVFCCIESASRNPIREDFEIFDLFHEYTEMLFRRYAKFNEEEIQNFLFNFGKVIHEEFSTVQQINHVKEKAVDIGILNKDSGVKRFFTRELVKPKFSFPHKLFKDYFEAIYLQNEEAKFPSLNSRTYLSYFLSGLSKTYKDYVFINSWNKLIEVYRLPYLAHTEDIVDELILECKRKSIVFHDIPSLNDDSIYLPDLIINKLIPNVNTAYFHGAHLTGKIKLANYFNIGLSECIIDESFCCTLLESEIEVIGITKCSFVSSGQIEVYSTGLHSRIKAIICRGAKIINFLKLLGSLPHLNTFHLELVAEPKIYNIDISMYPQLQCVSLDYDMLLYGVSSLLTFSNLHSLSVFKIFNSNAAFPGSLLQEIVQTNGFHALRELHFINDNRQSLNGNDEEPVEEIKFIFPNLTTIILIHCNTIETLTLLEHHQTFQKLENLTVHSLSQNNDEYYQRNFYNLKMFAKLQNLALIDMRLSSQCLSFLSDIPNLQHLDISNYNLSYDHNVSNFFTNFSTWDDLRSLNFARCKFDQKSFDAFDTLLSEKLLRLNSLNLQIEDNPPNNYSFPRLKESLLKFIDLKRLSLTNVFGGDIFGNNAELLKLPSSLEILDMSKLNMNYAPRDFFSSLSNLSLLNSLSINVVNLKKEHIVSLVRIIHANTLARLEKLQISGSNEFISEFLAMLHMLTCLKELTFIDARLRDKEVEVLAASLEKMQNLTSLDLGISNCTDQLLNVLAGMTSLTKLSLPWEICNQKTVTNYLAARYRVLILNFHQHSPLFENK